MPCSHANAVASCSPPHAPLCVDDPEIADVIDTESGEVLAVQQLFGTEYDELVALRVAIYRRMVAQQPRFLCALCHTPVYIVRRLSARRFFFRHRIEDGRCSARTRGTMSEELINAIKYDGLKEGLPHIRMKELIAQSLSCDARFADIRVESVVRGTEPGKWRKPDVHAVYDGARICFEAQLSTTFLRVIAERMEFYLRENATLCWVFQSFPIESRRLLQDDIFYANNRNVFIVNEQTLRESQERHSFVMLCRWLQPVLQDDRIVGQWQDRLASFCELTVDQRNQRIYLFDCEGEAARLRAFLWSQSWMARFEDYWVHANPDALDVNLAWRIARDGLRERGEGILPRYPEDTSEFRGLLNGLYSIKFGRCVGWKFPTLIQSAHRFLTCAPRWVWLFVRAIKYYGRLELLRKEDRTGKWECKMDRIDPMWDTNDDVRRDPEYDWLTSRLFPELYRSSLPGGTG